MAKLKTFEDFEDFEADMPARQAAVTAAGWHGNAARVLMLRGDTPAEFEGHLVEASTMRAIANMVRAQLADMHIDVDMAVERSIIHGIPLADVRAIIVQRMAEHDEATNTDTARPLQASAHAGDIYADRKAQMKAGNVR